jgi:hypothetical protein
LGILEDVFNIEREQTKRRKDNANEMVFLSASACCGQKVF